MKGELISLEGPECSGKGTQAQLLYEYLQQKGIPVHLMHEPGGSYYGEAIRALLKFPERALKAIYHELSGHGDFPLFEQYAAISDNGHLDIKRTAETELFLFEATRAEYAAKLKPLLDGGDVIISDRLHDSTVAYQGGGRGLPMTDIDLMNKIALRGIWPDLTFLLDIPVEVMLDRMSRQRDEKNAFFEKHCDQAFFERVREAYVAIALSEPKRFIIIDGNQPIETVFKQIRAYVDELLGIED